MRSLSNYAHPFLRITLAFVFLYFGFQQIYSPENWTGFVPSFITNIIITASNIVIFNGILELTLGTFILIGIYTRVSALILSIHLVGIALAIGFTPLGVRDFGLAAATFTLFLIEDTKYSVDNWSNKRQSNNIKNN